MIREVESKQKNIRRWSMTIYIDSTYQKHKICDMVFLSAEGRQSPENIKNITNDAHFQFWPCTLRKNIE
jgi:hypothetical protein